MEKGLLSVWNPSGPSGCSAHAQSRQWIGSPNLTCLFIFISFFWVIDETHFPSPLYYYWYFIAVHIYISILNVRLYGHVTWSIQVFADNLFFNLRSSGVIRNQRSKILWSSIISTVVGPFRKISQFVCRVIKHARLNILKHKISLKISFKFNQTSDSSH